MPPPRGMGGKKETLQVPGPESPSPKPRGGSMMGFGMLTGGRRKSKIESQASQGLYTGEAVIRGWAWKYPIMGKTGLNVGVKKWKQRFLCANDKAMVWHGKAISEGMNGDGIIQNEKPLGSIDFTYRPDVNTLYVSDEADFTFSADGFNHFLAIKYVEAQNPQTHLLLLIRCRREEDHRRWSEYLGTMMNKARFSEIKRDFPAFSTQILEKSVGLEERDPRSLGDSDDEGDVDRSVMEMVIPSVSSLRASRRSSSHSVGFAPGSSLDAKGLITPLATATVDTQTEPYEDEATQALRKERDNALAEVVRLEQETETAKAVAKQLLHQKKDAEAALSRSRSNSQCAAAAADIADALAKAMKGFGTDEEGLYKALGAVQDPTEWEAVRRQFRTRHSGVSGGDVGKAIKSELSKKEMVRANAILFQRGVDEWGVMQDAAKDLSRALENEDDALGSVDKVLECVSSTADWQMLMTAYREGQGGADLREEMDVVLLKDEKEAIRQVLAGRGVAWDAPATRPPGRRQASGLGAGGAELVAAKAELAKLKSELEEARQAQAGGVAEAEELALLRKEVAEQGLLKEETAQMRRQLEAAQQ
eukprot:Hpha_TRINITY_DN15335_c1_g7::TRINITY_DN15335_c1_g7_i1::g.92003::m.92003